MRLAVLVLLGATACVVTRPPGPERSSWRWRGTRRQALAHARVWIGGDLAAWRARMIDLDLLAGPPRAGVPAVDGRFVCDYEAPRAPLGGATPKFLCAPAAGDTVKVKWGAENGEVYAEVAGTRLLWALGFPADAVYPVSVECRGCSPDPWRTPEPPAERPITFAPAIVEYRFPGETAEERPDQGWSWRELRAIVPSPSAPRTHADALMLLAAFMQHRDSKADNQRLVCAHTRGRSPRRARCRDPVMLIDDLGSTFGGAVWFGTGTVAMDLTAWRAAPVWADARRCVANVMGELDAVDGLEHPGIGEDGRRFLSALLDVLSERQIRDLFTAARAGQRAPLAQWVAAFIEKREQVRHPVPEEPAFRCPRRPASAARAAVAIPASPD